MPIQPSSRFPFVTVAIVAAIAIAWVLAARHLHLPMLAFQKSSNLLLLGAMNGVSADNGEWWRLVTSQFLHVYFMHMLFNLCAIALLAMALERSAGSLLLALTYLGGGAIGQYFSVLLAPELVSSGASQALMALCGFILVGIKRFPVPRFAPILTAVVVAIQAALDVYVSGSIKPGHSFGFGAGMLIAIAAHRVRGRANGPVPNPLPHYEAPPC